MKTKLIASLIGLALCACGIAERNRKAAYYNEHAPIAEVRWQETKRKLQEQEAAREKMTQDAMKELQEMQVRSAYERGEHDARTKLAEEAAKRKAQDDRRTVEANKPKPSPEARQIDEEVAKIMAGNHGVLPPAQRLQANGGEVVTMKVKNDTEYTLTVLYSGPTSQKVVVAPNGSDSVSISTGAYKIAAKVSSPTVIPYAGDQSISGGIYENTFYIKTSFR